MAKFPIAFGIKKIFTIGWTAPIGAFCAAMAIYRLIANGSFGPEKIKAMTAAYEAALLDLALVDRDDPITEIVATAIVSVASMGELDPATIKDRAFNAMGIRSFNSDAA